MRTLFRSESDHASDAAACRVCGHRTQPIIRRTLNLALVLVIGALLGYIALDIVEDGRVDGSIFHAISGHAVPCTR
jgi:hypothetical protein